METNNLCQNLFIQSSKQTKEELTRLLVQALKSLGYTKSATTLQEESNTKLEENLIHNFRENLMQGKWTEVVELLPNLGLSTESGSKIEYLIMEQKYLELVESRNVQGALDCLREELTPLSEDSDRLHKLASFLLCRNAKELFETASWEGAQEGSRIKLILSVQNFMPPKLMISENRLETLLSQAISYQTSFCKYHNTEARDFSFLNDHQCPKKLIPAVPIQVLDHDDEVWMVTFSMNGLSMASVTKSCSILIWAVNPEDNSISQKILIDSAHSKEMTSIGWSYCSKFLVSTSYDRSVKLWSAESGDCLATFTNHSEEVRSAIFTPDNCRIISASADRYVIVMDLEGRELHRWKAPRVGKLSISEDGSRMVGSCLDKNCLLLFQLDELNNYPDPQIIEVDDIIVSSTISRDGRYLVGNVSESKPELYIWDLETKKCVRRLFGHSRKTFAIRCTFGGINDQFIACGSEDCNAYIWNRNDCHYLERLVGHGGAVNDVAWSPINPYLLLTASDDHTIRVWSCPEHDSDGSDHSDTEMNDGHSED